MNSTQIAKQIEYLLLARTWGGTGSKVFHAAKVTPMGAADAVEATLAIPFALIHVSGLGSDDESPEKESAAFEVEVCADVPNDPYMTAAMVGGVRTDLTQSLGRGLLELEAEVKAAIGTLTGTNGINMVMRKQSAIAVSKVGTSLRVARSTVYTAECHTQAYYHPARNLVAAVSSGLSVTLTWTLPPDRWDRKRVVLRRASGATAPASATAGTGITLSGDLATSVIDTPGAGTWSYALFAAYDITGDGTVNAYSAAVTREGIAA